MQILTIEHNIYLDCKNTLDYLLQEFKGTLHIFTDCENFIGKAKPTLFNSMTTATTKFQSVTYTEKDIKSTSRTLRMITNVFWNKTVKTTSTTFESTSIMTNVTDVYINSSLFTFNPMLHTMTVKTEEKLQTKLILGIIFGIILLVVLALLGGIFCKRKFTRSQRHSVSLDVMDPVQVQGLIYNPVFERPETSV